MKRIVLLLFVALLLGACSALPADLKDKIPVPAPKATAAPTRAADDWKDFTHSAGRFSVKSPGEFMEKTETAKTVAGSIDVHMFMDNELVGAYAVGYCDYPQEVVKGADTNVLLDGAVNGAMNSVSGKLVSKVAGVQDGYQAREFRGEGGAGSKMPGGVVKGRVFLVKNRLYQVFVVTTKDQESKANVDKFLNSFKFNAGK